MDLDSTVTNLEEEFSKAATDVDPECIVGESSEYYTLPPKLSIRNGNYISEIPVAFNDLNRSEETSLALMVLTIFLATVIGTGRKSLNSHHYMIKNPKPIIQSIPAEVNGTVRYALVGAFTREQEALLRKRTILRVDKCREYLQFLKENNAVYQAYENSIDEKKFDSLNLDDFVIDRTNLSENLVNPKLNA